jgi:hypothetical protein
VVAAPSCDPFHFRHQFQEKQEPDSLSLRRPSIATTAACNWRAAARRVRVYGDVDWPAQPSLSFAFIGRCVESDVDPATLKSAKHLVVQRISISNGQPNRAEVRPRHQLYVGCWRDLRG